eukprot:104186-Prymnesium_polylepis.1
MRACLARAAASASATAACTAFSDGAFRVAALTNAATGAHSGSRSRPVLAAHASSAARRFAAAASRRSSRSTRLRFRLATLASRLATRSQPPLRTSASTTSAPSKTCATYLPCPPRRSSTRCGSARASSLFSPKNSQISVCVDIRGNPTRHAPRVVSAATARSCLLTPAKRASPRAPSLRETSAHSSSPSGGALSTLSYIAMVYGTRRVARHNPQLLREQIATGPL